jgi:phosphate transport system permease protein
LGQLGRPLTARRRLVTERGARWAATAAGSALVAVVVLILAFMTRESLPLFSKVNLWRFLSGRHWYPVSNPPSFEILPFIASSALVTFFALVLAVPVGLAAAMYLAEMATSRVRLVVRPLLELLAGIPSIIYGLVGLLILSPLVRSGFGLSTGLTGLTAAMLLAVMVLPTIISLADEAMRAVPRDFRDASLALGATQWQTLTRVTLPAAASGVKAALMLAGGRALGETMLVLMVAGGRVSMPTGIAQPMRTMTATLATEVNNAAYGSDHYRALFGLGLVLLLVTLLLSIVAERQAQNARRRGGNLV